MKYNANDGVSGNCTIMRLVQFILTLHVLSACHSNSDNDQWIAFAIKADCNSVENRPFVFAKGIERDVPKTLIDPNASGLRCIEECLGLATLRNGYDGIEIRLWGKNSGALAFDDRVIIINDFKGRKNATVMNVRYTLRADSNNVMLDSLIGRKKALEEPRSGWTTFFQTVEKLGVYQLPNYSELPGYMVDSDPGGYSIEFATKTKYRRYTYPDPNTQNLKEAKQFLQLVRFIESEFAIN